MHRILQSIKHTLQSKSHQASWSMSLIRTDRSLQKQKAQGSMSKILQDKGCSCSTRLHQAVCYTVQSYIICSPTTTGARSLKSKIQQNTRRTRLRKLRQNEWSTVRTGTQRSLTTLRDLNRRNRTRRCTRHMHLMMLRLEAWSICHIHIKHTPMTTEARR